MKSTYEVTFEAVLPVLAKICIQAESETESAVLAERIAGTQKPGVKTTAFKIETYTADFLMVLDIAEITAVEPGESGEKVWNREELEQPIGRSNTVERYRRIWEPLNTHRVRRRVAYRHLSGVQLVFCFFDLLTETFYVR